MPDDQRLRLCGLSRHGRSWRARLRIAARPARRLRPHAGITSGRIAGRPPALATAVLVRHRPVLRGETTHVVQQAHTTRELRIVERSHTVQVAHAPAAPALPRPLLLTVAGAPIVERIHMVSRPVAAAARQALTTVLARHVRIEHVGGGAGATNGAAVAVAAGALVAPPALASVSPSMELRRTPAPASAAAPPPAQRDDTARPLALTDPDARGPKRTPITAGDLDIEDVTSHVLQRIERRAWAQRERRGEG